MHLRILTKYTQKKQIIFELIDKQSVPYIRFRCKSSEISTEATIPANPFKGITVQDCSSTADSFRMTAAL